MQLLILVYGTFGKVYLVAINWATSATVKKLKKLLHEVNKNIFFFPSDFGYSITEIFLNTYFITLLFMISWDRFLFKPLDTLQWPLLPQESGSENMV